MQHIAYTSQWIRPEAYIKGLINYMIWIYVSQKGQCSSLLMKFVFNAIYLFINDKHSWCNIKARRIFYIK